MTQPSNGSTSFGVYEGLRIIIPGYYLTLLLWFFIQFIFRMSGCIYSFDLPASVLIIAGIVSGLLLYATEGSKRRRAFRENRPSMYLLDLSRTINVQPPLEETDAQRMYFFILNSYMPSTFHQRIFFFGMVFHVLTTIRRVTLWFAVMGIGVLLIHQFAVFTLQYDLSFVFFTLILIVLYLLIIRYNKADRKMQENYQDQIHWLKMHQRLVIYLLTHNEAPSFLNTKE